MNKFEKEHVTLYFYRNSQKFLIKNFIFNKKIKLIKTAIDNKKDLINVLKAIEKKEFKLYTIFK
jgi:spore coat polysaccharide biosynthesis protein SpsF (cytidylyltransferase family)